MQGFFITLCDPNEKGFMSHFPICLSHCEEHHHSRLTNSNSQPHPQALLCWWSELLLSQSWTQRIGQESLRDVHYLCISPALGPGQVSADTNMHICLAVHVQSRWWWLSVQGPLMLREAESAHKRPKNLQEKKVVQLMCTTIYSQVTTLPISALLRLC
jgi:hypothetical protein